MAKPRLKQVEAPTESQQATTKQVGQDTWLVPKGTTLTQPPIFYKVLARIASGQTFHRVCTGKTDQFGNQWPTVGQVQYRIRTDDAYKKEYDRARELQGDSWVDEIIDIADNIQERGTYEKINDDGSTRKQEQYKQVERDKLKISTRQWVLGRRFPKLYGDSIRQEISNDLQNVKPVINIIKS